MSNSGEFFKVLAGLAGDIIVLVVAFVGAYLVYLRERRDFFREKILDAFTRLDDSLLEFSTLEPKRMRENYPMQGDKLLMLLEKESWKDNLREAIKKGIEKVEKVANEAQEKQGKRRMETEDRDFDRYIIFSKVMDAIGYLFNAFYKEFPSPRDPRKIKQRDSFSLFTNKFPENTNDFLNWAQKFGIYYDSIFKIRYFGSIWAIITDVQLVIREHLDFMTKSEEHMRQYAGVGYLEEQTTWQREITDSYKKYLIDLHSYYDKFFQNLKQISKIVEAIRESIVYYDRYRLQNMTPIIVGIIIMSFFGVFIPLYMVQPMVPEEIIEWAVMILSISIFSVTTSGVIIYLYKEITK